MKTKSIKFFIRVCVVILIVTTIKSYSQCPTPTQSSNQSGCAGTYTLSVTSLSSPTVTSHRWYTAPSGGSQITPTNQFSPVSDVWVSQYQASFSSSVTYYVAAVCSGVESSSRKSVSFTLNSGSNVSISITPGYSPTSLCQDGNFKLTANNGTSYEWRLNGSFYSSATQVTPTVSGTYTLYGYNACGTYQNASIPITMAGNVSVSSITCDICTTNARCQAGGTTQFNATASNSTDVTWSVSPGAAGSVSATGLMTWSSSFYGSATITITATGCNGPAVSNKSITVNQDQGTVQASIASSKSSVCQGEGIGFTLSGSNWGSTPSIQWKINGNDAPPSDQPQLGSQYLIYNSWNFPNNSTVQAFVTSSNSCVTPVPAPSNTITVPLNSPSSFTSNIQVLPARYPMEYCHGEISFSVSASHSVASYAWYKNGDTNNIMSTSSTYTPVTFEQGDYVSVLVTAQANPCLSNTQATPTTYGMPITIVPDVSVSNISCDICEVGTRCQAGGTTQFSASINNSTGTTWSVTPGSAGTISSSGLMTWSSSFSGPATITVSATGCSGPKSSAKAITVNPDQGTVTANISATKSSICQSEGIAFTLNGSSGGNWGSTPTIEWRVDGNTPPSNYLPQFYPNQLIYESWSGSQNFNVQALVTSSLTCVSPKPAPTNTIPITINAKSNFTANIQVLPARFPMEYCHGEISFSVSASHPAASYAWYKNGDVMNIMSTASTYTPVTFEQGDYVSVIVNAQANPCLNNTQITPTTQGMPITIVPDVYIDPITCDICSPDTQRCQGDGTTQFNATAHYATSVVWSVTPPEAGSISLSTGLMTWNPSYSGTASIVAEAAGCLGPKSVGKTIVVNPTLPAPGVTITGQSEVCPGSGIGFTATGSNLTEGTTYTWHVNDGVSDYTVTSDNTQLGPQYLILNSWNYPDGSYVYCVVDRGQQCSPTNTATSNSISVSLTSTEVLTVNITTDPFEYPPVYCANEIDFVATSSHPSSFTWYKNEVPIATTNGPATTSTYDPVSFNSDNDVLEVRVVAAAGSCLSNNEASATLASSFYKIGLLVGEPTINVSGLLERCEGEGTTTFYAIAENANDFQWSITPGAGTLQPSDGNCVVNWSPGYSGNPTIYVVASGCENSSESDDYVYTIHPLPVKPEPSTIVYCDFEIIILRGNGGPEVVNHNWFDNNQVSLGTAAELSLDVRKNGSYYFEYEAISEFGCVNTDRANLTINVIHDPSCNDKLNWIETVTYNYGTNGQTEIGHSKSYFDLAGKPLQTLSKNFTNGKIFTSQSVRDQFDRVALATLAAPLNQTGFDYHHWVAQDQLGGLFDYTDLGESLGNQPGTIGEFYNPDNTNSDAPKSLHPFSQTDFYEDGTGEVRRTSAPGGELRMGQGKEVWSGTFPVYSELNDYLTRRRAIGLQDSQLSNSLKGEAIQSVSRDQNGKFAVSISDKSGKAVFSARAGTSTDNVLSINNVIEADATDSKKLTYFYLLEASPVTINNSSGTYVAEDLMTNVQAQSFEDSNNENKWPAGFYRLIVTSGTVTLSYSNYFLDVSYQFYDDAGRLVSSISPNGYVSWSSPSGDYTRIDKTTYQYNFQGWLLEMNEPDAGITKYAYRKDGKIRFSQNAEQRIISADYPNGRYSYTSYDQLGRPVESGELVVGSQNDSFDLIKVNTDSLEDKTGTWLSLIQNDLRRDWVKTYYDFPDTLFPLNSIFSQQFLRGAVSYTENENNKTWYSYDELGRVTWFAQKPTGMNVGGVTRVFVTQYEYDFLGNVTHTSTVMYANGNPLQSTAFHHHYGYDADNRLSTVHTSTDGTTLKPRANYSYYLHGPLKRIELGDKVQGIDFVYNINGWLTQINHPDNANDPGGDGTTNDFRKDAFGMVLDYYENTLANTFASALNKNQIQPELFHGLPQKVSPILLANSEQIISITQMNWKEMVRKSFVQNFASPTNSINR